MCRVVHFPRGNDRRFGIWRSSRLLDQGAGAEQLGGGEGNNMPDYEEKTFTTQEGPNRGRDKPGPDKEKPAAPPKPKDK